MTSRFDLVFKISVILKGLDALVETVAGIALFFVTGSNVDHFASWLRRSSIARDPNNYIGRLINDGAKHLVHASTLIGAIYLLAHGLIKLVVIINVLRDKYWAYPVLIIVLAVFCVIQIIDIINHHSIAVALLTAFDILVIILTWFEWQKKRRKKLGHSSETATSITN